MRLATTAAALPMDTSRRNRRRLLMRGALGFTALAGYYWTLGALSLAEATTMQNTAPIWSALLAWWLLRERVARATALGLVLGGAGVVMVAQPWAVARPGGAAELVAVLIALAAAVASASAYVTVRHLARTEHPLVIVFYFPLVALFALLHVGPGRRFLPWTLWALVMGLVFGALVELTGDLGAPIVAHFTINFLNLHYIARVELPARPRLTPPALSEPLP